MERLIRGARAFTWVLGVTSLLLSISCSPGGQPGGAASPSAAPSKAAALRVDACPVRVVDLPDTIQVVGNFRAVTESSVSPERAGAVVDVPVRVGQFVPKGGVLIQLSRRSIEIQLEQDRADILQEQARLGLTGLHQALRSDEDAPAVRKARVALDNAQLEWERAGNLFRANLISQKDLQDARKTLLSAQLDHRTELETVQRSKAAVAYKRTMMETHEHDLLLTTVRAPFAGYVASRKVEAGDYISPGNAELIKMVTLDPIYCQLEIPEASSRRLSLGQEIDVATPAQVGKTFRGRVRQISPAVDPASRTLKVDALVQNPGRVLRPGLYGNVSLILGTRRGVRLVPQAAVVMASGLVRVFVVDRKAGRAPVARAVTMARGDAHGSWIEALESGLKPGDQVVVSDVNRLYDQMPLDVGSVRPEPPSASGSPSP